MNKTILNIILILVTLALVAYSVYLAIKGDESLATYCLVWALTVHVIVRSYIA